MTAKYVNTVIDYQEVKKNINGIAFLLQDDLHATVMMRESAHN